MTVVWSDTQTTDSSEEWFRFRNDQNLWFIWSSNLFDKTVDSGVVDQDLAVRAHKKGVLVVSGDCTWHDTGRHGEMSKVL